MLVPRLVARLGDEWRGWAASWGDTRLPVPTVLGGMRWTNAMSGEAVETQRANGAEHLPVGPALACCPVGILVGTDP